jgi:hypothetical protein
MENGKPSRAPWSLIVSLLAMVLAGYAIAMADRADRARKSSQDIANALADRIEVAADSAVSRRLEPVWREIYALERTLGLRK